jgi:hypothetical protein
MYPGMMGWWKSRHGHDCGASAGCGQGGHEHHEHHGHEGHHGGWAASGPDEGDYGSGGAFGVRRPLRFLAYKLGLNEAQVAELAKILNDLKTERAQAAVDHRRTVAAFADAIVGDAFDNGRATEGGDLRVKSANTLRDAVVKALGRIHALLDPRQRGELAYLIRTGTLSI